MDRPLLKVDEIDDLSEVAHIHQFNDQAVRQTRSLGDLVGLEHVGIHLVRIEPGYESTQFHYHHQDEEFIYVLSGRGIAEIGDEEFEIGPGDFMGFGRNSSPHAMRNPFDTDLSYLIGGSRSKVDICDHPRLKRRMYRVDGKKTYVDLNDLHSV